MRFLDIARFSAKAMMSRRRRTLLTLIGIMVGVLTLTAVVSYAEGYGVYLSHFFKGASMRTIFVMSRSELLTPQDLYKLEGIPGVERAFPIIFMPVNLKLYGVEETVTLLGIDMNYVHDVLPDISLEEGVMPVGYSERSCVMGYDVAKKFSDEPSDLVGVSARVEQAGIEDSLRISSVAKPYGTAIFTDVDHSVIVPIGFALKLSKEVLHTSNYPIIAVIASSVKDVDGVLNEIRSDFGVNRVVPVAMKDVQRGISKIINISLLILGGIAAMTIVVASIGMMNAMYTAVTERVKIIGVMRTIGASRKDISLMFLMESLIIGIIGTVLGMITGYLGALTLSYILSPMLGMSTPHGEIRPIIAPTLPPWIALAIFLTTLLITTLGAVPPAMRAAQLEPAEALRYE